MMTDKAQLLSELSDIANAVSDARRSLEGDNLIVLDGIDSRVEKFCRSVVDLLPDDALEVRPILNSLLDDLKELLEELQTKVRTLSG